MLSGELICFAYNSGSLRPVHLLGFRADHLQSWVSYSHRAFVDDAIVLNPLQALTQTAIMCLAEDGLYEITIELLSDTLTNYSKFLRKEDFAVLKSLFNSTWAQERYQRLVKGDYDFDSLQFGMFMIAFGDATVTDLARNCDTDPQSYQYLSALCALLGAEGYAVHEDKIYVPALEFWSTFVETMIDDAYASEGEKPTWFPTAQELVRQVIERCWLKSQLPPPSEYSSWDSVDRVGFKDARRDFSDLLQQFYITTGIPLLQVFIDLLQKSATAKNWAELEAATYCLSWFSDCIAEDSERYEYLDKVFTSSFISLFSDPNAEVPTRAMKGFLDLVNVYTYYFYRRPSSLSGILNIVFSATGLPSLSKTASKSIMKLCSDCRKILVPELGVFLQHYDNIASNYTLDDTVKEAVMEGIASIIQALDSDEVKLAPLKHLLDYVQADVEKCLELAPQPSTNGLTALNFGTISLKCLAAIAKGIQTPADIPVDLEKVAEAASPFWSSGEGSDVHLRIYLMMTRVFDVLGDLGDIVEEICIILRQGFREEEPGPFVLPARLAAKFLMRANLQTPRLGRVLTTAASLISSHKLDADIEAILDTLLSWVAQILQDLGGKFPLPISLTSTNYNPDPGNDPEVAQAGIDFLHRLLFNFPQVLLRHQPASSLEYLFMFALKALAGTEPLPKASAAEFWSAFISVQSPTLQPLIESAVQQIGPLLAQALIYNIGGHAARSDLDKLSDPLKKLVVRQVNAKAWFEAALMGDSFPSSIVTPKDKSVFLTKITRYFPSRPLFPNICDNLL